MLSPLLFNIYLEEALKSVPHLAKCVQQDRLRAYADDLLITGDTEQEIKLVISDLQKLEIDYNLKLNLKKSVIISNS